MKPRKHADLIKAWADGAEIEYFDALSCEWRKTDDPLWDDDTEYRIKLAKWEPEGGDFWISSFGYINETKTCKNARLFGTERKTKELAERAAKEMRAFNRLLAYRDEFCPDYEPDWNDHNAVKYVVYLDNKAKKWDLSKCYYCQYLTVYFPQHIAEELVKKLNSGEVEL